MGPTRNVVNLTSQHGAMQTIWPVNRVQSHAEHSGSERIITENVYSDRNERILNSGDRITLYSL